MYAGPPNWLHIGTATDFQIRSKRSVTASGAGSVLATICRLEILLRPLLPAIATQCDSQEVFSADMTLAASLA